MHFKEFSLVLLLVILQVSATAQASGTDNVLGQSAASPPPSTFSIRLSDLHSGYSSNGPTHWTPTSYAAWALGLLTQRDGPRRHGWVAAYSESFALSKSRQTDAGPHIVNTIAQYRDGRGAHWDYGRAFVPVCAGNFKVLNVPRFGNESVGCSAVSDDILFREGRYVVHVTVAGTGHDTASVIQLAALVLHRMRQSGQ